MNLPTGTITFLFTDIEGSTRLWERCPDAMRLALARHDRILRDAIEAQNGYVFKTVGDAFCAAFPTALEALNASLAAQSSLVQETWGDTGPIRVRMGLHIGEAQERDNDYFGPTLNRAARLQSIAYGGQILVSQATYELVRDRLPGGVSLESKGLHRLKDLNRAEQVFQVLHPGLPAEFPQLHSLDNLPNNLPIQLTSFVGRELEMKEVKRLFTSHSLLTLVGPGGAGKTRISLQVGADLLDQFSDGVWFVEFAPVSDPAMAAPAIAAVLGIKEEAGRPALQTLGEYLKPRTLLLILDNCEHLVAACAQIAHTLLQSCPHLKIIASSREAFNVPGEMVYRVPSLQMPDPRTTPTLEALTQFEAVRLFIDRAVSIQAAFTVTAQNAPALAQLCAHLDGIPLAIELAAARVRSLSVEEINSKLDNCIRLLTGGSRTALPRQQTLRALIDWSYDLLSAQEKALFRNAGVFSGGWALESAESVCAGEEVEEWEILDLLTGLADKSLVIVEQTEGPPRFRLLETMRQYACDRLLESGDAQALKERHHAYFHRLAHSSSAHLVGPEQQAILDSLEKEHANLRVALEWALANSPAGAIAMAVALGNFWYLGGHLREGRDYLERAITSQPQDSNAGELADAYYQLGRLLAEIGDYAAARSYLEPCLASSRQTGNKRLASAALNSLGIVTLQQDDYGAARSFLEESLCLRRELGNQEGVAATLSNLGNLLMDQGDYTGARTLLEESLTIERAIQNKRGMATALTNLGDALFQEIKFAEARITIELSLAIAQELHDEWYGAYALCILAAITTREGDYARARALAEECLAAVRNVGDQGQTACALFVLGEIACLEADFTQAHARFQESLEIFKGQGQKKACVSVLEAFAGLAVRIMDSLPNPESDEARAIHAATLLGASEIHRENLGTPLPPMARTDFDANVSALRSALDPAAFSAAWQAGRAMTFEQAIAAALATVEIVPRRAGI